MVSCRKKVKICFKNCAFSHPNVNLISYTCIKSLPNIQVKEFSMLLVQKTQFFKFNYFSLGFAIYSEFARATYASFGGGESHILIGICMEAHYSLKSYYNVRSIQKHTPPPSHFFLFLEGKPFQKTAIHS